MDLHKGEALIMRSSSLTFSVRPTTTTNPATIEYDDKLHGWLIASDNDYRYVVFPMSGVYRIGDVSDPDSEPVEIDWSGKDG